MWHGKQNSILGTNQALARQLSNNLAANTNFHHNHGIQTFRGGSCRNSERLSSPTVKNFNYSLCQQQDIDASPINPSKRLNGQHHQLADEPSVNIRRDSDEQCSGRYSSIFVEAHGGQSSCSPKIIATRQSSQTIKSYFLGKVRSLGSSSSGSSKQTTLQRTSAILVAENGETKLKKDLFPPRRKTLADVSLSTSSCAISGSHSSQRKASFCNRMPTVETILNKTFDDNSNNKESLTSL